MNQLNFSYRNPYCDNENSLYGGSTYGNATFIQNSNPGQCKYFQVEGLEKTAAENVCSDYIKAVNVSQFGDNIKMLLAQMMI